jgi:hypothetical protein
MPKSSSRGNPYTQTGYRQHASGLLVPPDISREREVWTRDEWKVLERAAQLLKAKGVDLFLGCPEPDCKGAPMTRVRRNDGAITLRCAHKDREFQAR